MNVKKHKKVSKGLAKAKQSRETKNSLILGQSPMSAKQLLKILQRTPKNHVYTRKGKAGLNFDYVTGTYIKKVLNHVFAWLWNFQIIDKGREGNQVWVQGRLTINKKIGKSIEPIIIKEQFGRADVKMKRGTKEMMDYGNDLKAAATDALKKCASELGIASDIYGKNEFKDIQKKDKGFKIPEEYAEEAVVVKKTEKEPTQDFNYGNKVQEIMKRLNGKTEKEKLANLKKRTGINLKDFNITTKHAAMLLISLLVNETK